LQRLRRVRHHMQVRGARSISSPFMPQTKKSQLVKAGLGVAPATKAVPCVRADHAGLR